MENRPYIMAICNTENTLNNEGSFESCHECLVKIFVSASTFDAMAKYLVENDFEVDFRWIRI